MDKKRVLYEQAVQKRLSMDDYNTQKAVIDNEFDRTREIYFILKIQTSPMQMGEKGTNAGTKLVREVSAAVGLTTGLVEKLIDQMYFYPSC